MAGDWIKVETCTPDKPKVLAIAVALGIDPDAVVGKLLRVWIWAGAQTVDGVVDAPVDARVVIDRLTKCDGFAEAMRKVGWIGQDMDRLEIPKFDEHNTQGAKARALKSERMRRWRSKPVDAAVDAPVDAVKSTSRLPEKRREENTITPIVPLGDKSPIQLRIESWFHRRHTTPWSAAELRVWSKNHKCVESASDEELLLLEQRFSDPAQAQFRRKDLATLLNNWTAEIDRARDYKQNGNGTHQPSNPRAYSQQNDYSGVR